MRRVRKRKEGKAEEEKKIQMNVRGEKSGREGMAGIQGGETKKGRREGKLRRVKKREGKEG